MRTNSGLIVCRLTFGFVDLSSIGFVHLSSAGFAIGADKIDFEPRTWQKKMLPKLWNKLISILNSIKKKQRIFEKSKYMYVVGCFKS